MENIQLLPSETYNTSSWSGGKTSELFIYPENSSFKSGDYSLRISIATVEIETSTFTALPDVNRTLMVLDGKLALEHKGHHSIELNAFEQDQFSGDWITNSKGKVTDFNVMTKNNAKSIVQKIDIEATKTLVLTSAFDLHFIYVVSGGIQISDHQVPAKNAVVLRNNNYAKLTADRRFEKTEIILVSVDFN